jgi:hypothetical protein
MAETIDELVAQIAITLKDFQRATVDYVITQMYEQDRKKILVADEVGLGKTIIAKGVLLKALQLKYDGKRPFHVIYICSNQVLAHQNLRKLNPFRESAQPYSRLIFLAFRHSESNLPLRLSSLTPTTSFNITQSVGVKDERAIIFKLLHDYAYFANREETLMALFRGNRQIGETNWNNLAGHYIRNADDFLRPGLSRKFKVRLESVSFQASRMPQIAGFIQIASGITLWEGIQRLVNRLHQHLNIDPLSYAYELIRILRYELTQVCVEFLDADLFILDEFQRFKTLLDGEDQSEAGEIARAVLGDDQARVLLLSATPFKSFTTRLEELSHENHFNEFKKLVIFLGGKNGETIWESVRQDQEAFFQMLRFPRETLDKFPEAVALKTQLEQKLKTLMTRNERLSVANDNDDMVLLNTQNRMKVLPEDVRNFIAIDQAAEILKEIVSRNSRFSGSVMEFSKSVPYPLSYLRGYNLREILNQFKDVPEIKALLRKNKDSFIDFNKINNYRPIGMMEGRQAYPNGKLRVLADECFDHNGHLLLWVPPSKPYYAPFGVYAKSVGFSKILVFSGWVMVPRAVSTLLSYEAERRTIGQEDMAANQEKGRRSYFTSDNKRHPRPMITYPGSEDKLRMTNICLTYPAIIFHQWISADVFAGEDDQKYTDIRARIIKILKTQIGELDIEARFMNNARVDPRWYWLLPALTDRLHDRNLNLAFIVGEESGAKRLHYQYLQRTMGELIQGTGGEVGMFPNDIFEVMADLVLSAPANVALRIYSSYFPGSQSSQLCAYKTADAFVSLFNKPESIAVIRLSSKDDVFWRQVLSYCASGNILAMLEEYVYLLMDCENKQTPEEISGALENILAIKTTNVKVDDRQGFYDEKGKDMRCHFAISYGDQKIGTEAGNDRMVNVREVFNSPFRPFVLTSTSIGQEGLDFHYYCRKILHWNLPHNPIDLEQREGRINRYKGLVIRQCLAAKIPLSKLINAGDTLWSRLFDIAERELKRPQDSDLVPFWYINDGDFKIERLVPIHEFSRDELRFERIKETLALYRLTFGQPRQEELLEAFRNAGLTNEEVQLIRSSLLINLSPLERTDGA